MPKKTFTAEDLRHWQEKGLLSEEQLQQITAEAGLETVPGAAPETQPGETGTKLTKPIECVNFYSTHDIKSS